MRIRTFATAAAFAALFAAQPSNADPVSDWWEFAGRIAPQQAQTTPDGYRAASRMALAMFEAANAIDRRYQTYLDLPQADATASDEAAVVTAAYRVLLHHFPQHAGALEESYIIAMAEIAPGAARDAGQQVGEAAAALANAAGGIDPAVARSPYRPRTTPGEWIGASLPSLENWMISFRPWAIPSVEALRAPPPPALDSDVWERDYEEVRRLGGRGSSERTPYESLMARYRQAPDLAPALRAAAEQPGRTLVQNARMYALYQIATDDAIMPMIESKYHYNFWRPITAIRNGDADGSDRTQLDAAWLPLISTPNFPEYPCGHCTFAAAAAEVMKEETGPAPAGGVRVASVTIPNSVLQVLPSWDQWVEQVSHSRTLGGVHYRFSNQAGEDIGRRAARIVLDKIMRPLP